MKNSIALLIIMFPLLADAQARFRNIPYADSSAYTPIPINDNMLFQDSTIGFNNQTIKKIKFSSSMLKSKSYEGILLGTTYFDVQSSRSSGHRVMLNKDGSISATWILSPNDNSSHPLCGTGYNHKANGANFGAPVAQRIESYRTGWPSIGTLSNNTEWIITHELDSGGFTASNNNELGGNNWKTIASGYRSPSSAFSAPSFFRAVSSGNVIHMIGLSARFNQNNWNNVFDGAGVASPISYYRSLNGGINWERKYEILPDFDFSRFILSHPDEYAIDAMGNYVAIVTGGLGHDVLLWKSNDGGNTFKKYFVDSFPATPIGFTIALDTPYTNDGCVDVAIDQNGIAHAVFSLSRILKRDSFANSYSYFPATNGIIYWNEVEQKQIEIGGAIDENKNGKLDIKPATWASHHRTPFPNPPYARTAKNSIANMPSVSVDDNGRVFVIYSAPRELDENIDEVNFRDVFINYSTNEGKDWAFPQNLTQNQKKEDAFPFLAKSINDFIHIIWQQDDMPGTNICNNQLPYNNHPAVENKILYAAVPVSEVVTDKIGLGNPVSNQEIAEDSKIFVVNQNYPNPFNEISQVDIYLSMQSDISLMITDIFGKALSIKTIKSLSAGNHTIDIDGKGLSGGLYFYSIYNDKYSITKTMIIR